MIVVDMLDFFQHVVECVAFMCVVTPTVHKEKRGVVNGVYADCTRSTR